VYDILFMKYYFKLKKNIEKELKNKYNIIVINWKIKELK